MLVCERVRMCLCAHACVCVNMCLRVPDDHFSVSVQVMKTDLILIDPLPLLSLPTKRIHRA